MKLSASFLSIQDNLEENLKKLDQTDIDYLHFDIMDGKFVKQKTWMLHDILPLVITLQKPFDLHFMVTNPKPYIESFAILNPVYMTIHYEAVENPLEMITLIHNLGIKAGMSIRPDTPIEVLMPYVDTLDLVLVMSVEPGMGGQAFLEESQEKIEKLSQIREAKNSHFVIEVDGGINNQTILSCKAADIVVVGSYITSALEYQKQVEELRKQITK